VHALLLCFLALDGNRLETRVPAAERAAFVTTLGTDTVALERFVRSATRVEGDIVLRIPGTVRFHYIVELGRDGAPSQSVLEQTPLAAPGIEPRRVTFALAGGVAPVFTTGFGSSFGLYGSLGLYELLLSRVPLRVGDTTSVPIFGVTSGRSGSLRVVRRSDEDIDVAWFQIAWLHLKVDADRRIVAVDARETTEKTLTHRTDDLDIDRLADDYAARDRAGRGLGVGSPDDTVRASVGAARVRVTYGRPRRRGRDLVGGVIPYDQVWRTGANAATVMTLDKDARIGGVPLPAGVYSLWTLPTRTGVTLVVSRDYGQWGTSYDPSHDVARVPLIVSTADAPVEQFTIDVPAAGGASVLRLRWGAFVWTVPIAVALDP